MTNDKQLTQLLEAIHDRYGYDFTRYAGASVSRRVNHYMEGKGINTFETLRERLLSDERTFIDFVEHLSITVTAMFRDPTFFRALRDTVIPRLATYPMIRIWIAGCATGQEAYSVAIILKEAGLLERSLIYATDINQRSLRIAQAGIYHVDNMKQYTTNYLESGGKRSFSEYYIAKYDSVMLDRSLKKNTLFAAHNLAADGSFNEFQLIICRNVIMYFNQELQNRVLNLFHASLCNFGYIGLGDKESLLFYENRSFFEEVDGKEKLYRRIK